MNVVRRCVRGVAAIVLLLCAAQAFSQSMASALDETTIRKQVDEVNLTFTVTDGKGRFVTGLTQDNFAILDDHHPPASVHRFQSLTELALRICVAIDASDSITNYLKFQQEVAIGFLKRILRPGVDQACLIKFTERPVLVQGFTSDIDKLEASVRRVSVRGSTAVWDALGFASEIIAKDDANGQVRRALVLITDGEDNSSHLRFDDALEAVLRAEIVVEVVNTIGTNTPRQEIKRLASMTGGNVWGGGKPKQLATALAKIEQSLRSQYFVAYRPYGEMAPGQFRKIQMKARGHRGKIAYRGGYFVPNSN
ncbi:MAG TPA: VWA domain-containing protein [Terriglobales bacterium]